MKAILTYHSIDNTGSPISMSAATFRHHVEQFASAGPRIVSITELLTLPADASAAAITFDDAFVNFAELAWPVLRDHALPVTLFVPTDRVGHTNSWSKDDRMIPSLPIAGWDMLGRLAEEGVTIGSHTCTHAYLTRLAPAPLRMELERSAHQLEQKLGSRPAGLAYPYGVHNARVVAAAAELYDYACTTELRPLQDNEDPHRLPRLDAYYLRKPGAIQEWGQPRQRFYLRARAGARRWRELLSHGSGR